MKLITTPRTTKIPKNNNKSNNNTTLIRIILIIKITRTGSK